MDQITQPVDILIRCTDTILFNEHSEESEMMNWSSLMPSTTRPLYCIDHYRLRNIKDYFQAKNWLLLPTSLHRRVMYLCSHEEFHTGISTYFDVDGPFRFIEESIMPTVDYPLCLLRNLSHLIQNELKDLFKVRAITHQQYKQMIYHSNDEIQFDSIAFVADTRQVRLIQQIRLFDSYGSCDLEISHIQARNHILSQSDSKDCRLSVLYFTGSLFHR